MDWYRVKIALRSPLKTPLANDTIWGHLCWGIFYFHGQGALTEFLDAYTHDPDPPLVISDAFPEDMLPLPVRIRSLPPPPGYRPKDVKKRVYVPRSFYIGQSAPSSPPEFLQEALSVQSPVPVLTRTIRARAAIGRKSATTVREEGGTLFPCEEYWAISPNGHKNPREVRYDIYVLTNTYTRQQIEDLFHNAFSFGYGAKASVGYGRVEVLSVDEEKTLPSLAGPTALTLGRWINTDASLLTSRSLSTAPEVRYGKLGGAAVVSQPNPHKKPVLLFCCGSTFDASLLGGKDYVGTFLSGLHSTVPAMLAAYAPIIKVHVP